MRKSRKEYMRSWRKKNSDKLAKYEIHNREYMRGYYATHKEEYKNRQKKYSRKSDYNQIKIWRKNNPDLHRKYRKTQKAKKRKLGFIPLNERFSGADAHHIDRECVVYVPHELHISIRHNIFSGKGMKEINDRVFEWLEKVVINID